MKIGQNNDYCPPAVNNRKISMVELIKINVYIQKQEKKEETLTEKMKRSPGERNTYTHNNLTEMF